jgi:hypothetical protein
VNWLSTILKNVDYLSGRYEAGLVRDEATRGGVLHVLDEACKTNMNGIADADVICVEPDDAATRPGLARAGHCRVPSTGSSTVSIRRGGIDFATALTRA